jgi:hypothetical protein
LDDSPKIKTGLSPTLRNEKLLHFLVRRLFAARVAELLRFHPLGVLLLVLRRCVVAIFAIAALQRNDFAHDLIPFSWCVRRFAAEKPTR